MTEREISMLIGNARTTLNRLATDEMVGELKMEKGLADHDYDKVKLRVDRDLLIENLSKDILSKGIKRWMGCAQQALAYIDDMGEIPDRFAQRFLIVTGVVAKASWKPSQN